MSAGCLFALVAAGVLGLLVVVGLGALSSSLDWSVTPAEDAPRIKAPSPDGAFLSVSVGYAHACGVRPDSSVSCWGRNSYGRANSPQGSFLSVSAGDGITCGVRSTGAAPCWGWFVDTGPPGRFVQVSAGYVHACALHSDGDVVCWGRAPKSGAQEWTSLFEGPEAWGAPDSPSRGGFVSIDVGYSYGCGVLTDGSLSCWGWDGDSGAGAPPSGTFESISAGGVHACAVRSDKTVACWGHNLDGRAAPPGGTFLSVSAGTFNTCGIRTDATIACWGSNTVGQSNPPDGSFVSVSVGDGHACAVRTDSTVKCWGKYPGGVEEGHSSAGTALFAGPAPTATPAPSATVPATPSPSTTAPAPSTTARPTPTTTPTATPTTTRTPTPSAGLRPGVQAIVTGLGGDELRIRSGPGQVYPQVSRLLEGETVRLLSGPLVDDAGAYLWWRVERGDGVVGWSAEGPADKSRAWLVPPGTVPPMPFRTFALSIERALRDGDTSFFWRTALTGEVTCTETSRMAVYGCFGKPDGSVVKVLAVANPWEGTSYRQDQYERTVAGWMASAHPGLSDTYGSGAAVFYATVVSGPPGAEGYHAIVTAIVDRSATEAPRRDVMVFTWKLVDGVWRHTRLWRGEGWWTEGYPPPASWLTGGCGSTSEGPCRDWQRWP